MEDENISEQNNDYTETQKTVQKTYENNIETSQKLPRKTTKKILIILAEKPNISMREIAEELNLTNDGIIWQINKLKSQGIIRREGADKGGK